MTRFNRAQLIDLCRPAIEAAGASPRDSAILAEATAEAELLGNRAVGVAHLFDYLDGYRQGRIAAETVTRVVPTAPAIVSADALGGLAQTAFADASTQFVSAIEASGLAALWISNSFTCGELGYYPRRLAMAGFIALGMANSPALMSIGGARAAVLGTNPLAYAVPRPGQLPVVVDQASSSTAFVNIRRAAEVGEAIPTGWALDRAGQPTQDSAAALEGTLLPFGSHRGGNIALLVEILATLAGASFSVDAAPFERGTAKPSIGVFLLGVDPARFAGSLTRLRDQFVRLTGEHQVQLPALAMSHLPEWVALPPELVQRVLDTHPS